MKISFFLRLLIMMALAGVIVSPQLASAEDKKPNILVIWGNDIGLTNIGFNSRGLMGYSTPNIDRIAKEGLSFTDYYGQQSCRSGAPRLWAATTRSAPA